MNCSRTIYFGVCLSIMMACGKKKEDEATVAPLVLASSLSIGCGSDGKTNCFSKGLTSLTAESNLANGDSQLDSMNFFNWMIVGFPASKKATYDAQFTTATAKANFPIEGLVDRIENIRKSITDAAVTEYKGKIGTCADAPTSGSFKFENTDVTWTSAKLTAPGDFPNSKGGKTFDKALTRTWTEGTTTLTLRFEFFCGYSGMAFALSVSEGGSETIKQVFFYDGESITNKYADFYLYIAADNMWLNFIMRQSGENALKTWINRVAVSGGNASGYRYATTIDAATPKISFYGTEVGTGSTVTESAFAANALSTSAAVTGGVAPGANGSSDEKKGCFASWTQPNSEVTSSTTCSGLDLSAPPAPFWSATASNSMTEMHANGKSKILDAGD